LRIERAPERRPRFTARHAGREIRIFVQHMRRVEMVPLAAA
jgi:hypothetical protein